MRFSVLVVLVVMLTSLNCSYFAKPAKEINMPSIFADNMVLQQEEKTAIWGTATPGGKVAVHIDDKKAGTIADENGNWQVKLRDLDSGGPYELKVIGADTTTFTNVMIGEVWVCSGQSNMEMPIGGWGKITNFEEELEQANFPNIRLFKVNHTMSVLPLDTLDAVTWQECTPKSVANFSAVAYFFGRDLHRTQSVPVGLIQTTWGGTPAEAWTTPDFARQLPDFADRVEELQSDSAEHSINAYEQKMQEWQKLVDQKMAEALDQETSWHMPDIDDSNWDSMQLPVLWEQAGLPGFDGIVWYRKTFNLSENLANQSGTLTLGPIDDIDVTFINGEQVGTTEQYNEPREYEIPAKTFKTGENVIAVKVVDTGGGGGIWGTAKQMALNFGEESISLSGDWRYKVGVNFKDLPPKPQSPESPHRPTVLYNAMVHPLIPYGMRGAIWYQGESNASRAYQYRSLFPTMIESWRAAWDRGDFPFYFVQLANFKQVIPEPVESEWAELREAQAMALSLSNTAMAVIIDIGEADDIHPKNKKDVGKRLALKARALVYGEDVVYAGPRYKSMAVEDSQVRISFDHVDGGLVAKGSDELKGFSIAGSDSTFVWAEAKIEDDTVIVSSPDVENPLAVRYAWADNPVCNLYNKEGLPAAPFRTDDWEGITKNVK